MSSLSAVVAGATGLTGRALVERLLEAPDYSRVSALVRRPMPHAYRLDVQVIDFEKPETWGDAVAAEHAFCCLGTTIKRAGSQEAFRRVDYDLQLEFAKRARARGANAFFVISALGADASSRLFYCRVKGELENAVAELDYPTLAIFRPSFLVGEREERRLGESLLSTVSRPFTPLFAGPLLKYRPIDADKVARAMLAVARDAARSRDGLGKTIYESDAIATLGS